MKIFNKYMKKLIKFYKSDKTNHFLNVIFLFSVMLICRQTLATDLLAGTTDDVTDTLNGSGRLWFILVDALLGIVAYIRSKNLLVFLGVFAITVFLTNILPLFLK